MRYKALYRPQYILGKQLISPSNSVIIPCADPWKDPESMTWDPLDGELTQKLDKRKYVSLSHDRALQSSSSSTSEIPNNNNPDGGELPELVDEESLSLFSIQMPGVMTADEVLKEIDLDHWLLLAYGTFIHMEDLVGWEDANITDPQSVKGIVAELVAVLGVEVAKKSACVLFD